MPVQSRSKLQPHIQLHGAPSQWLEGAMGHGPRPGSLFLQAALLLLPSLLLVPPGEGRGQGTPGTGLVLLRSVCQALPQSKCLGDFPNSVVDTPSLSPMATACISYARLPCRTHRTFRVLDLGKVLPWVPLGPASLLPWLFPLSLRAIPSSLLSSPSRSQ